MAFLISKDQPKEPIENGFTGFLIYFFKKIVHLVFVGLHATFSLRCCLVADCKIDNRVWHHEPEKNFV
jgi:hypothetical protein